MKSLFSKFKLRLENDSISDKDDSKPVIILKSSEVLQPLQLPAKVLETAEMLAVADISFNSNTFQEDIHSLAAVLELNDFSVTEEDLQLAFSEGESGHKGKKYLSAAEVLILRHGKNIGNTFFATNILSDDELEKSWFALAQEFVKNQNWEAAQYSFGKMSEQSRGDFYKNWHACTVNYIVGNIEKADVFFKMAQSMAVSDDQLIRLKPLEVLHELIPLSPGLSKVLGSNQNKLLEGLPKWIEKRIRWAFEGSVKYLTDHGDQIDIPWDSIVKVETGFGIEIESSDFWLKGVLQEPANLSAVRRYVNEELRKNSPKISEHALAALESQDELSKDDTYLLMACHLNVGNPITASKIFSSYTHGKDDLGMELSNFKKIVGSDSVNMEFIQLIAQQNPKSRDAQILYGLAAHKAGQQEIAANVLSPLTISSGSKLPDDIYYKLAVSLQMTNRHKEALASLKKIEISASSENDGSIDVSTVRALKAKILYQLGSFSKAIKISDDMLRSAPGDVLILKDLMLATRADGQASVSCQYAMKILACEDISPKDSLQALTIMSTQAMLSGDAEMRERAIELLSDSALVKASDWFTSIQFITLFIVLRSPSHAHEIMSKLFSKSSKSKVIMLWRALLDKMLGEEISTLKSDYTWSTVNQVMGKEVLLLQIQSFIEHGELDEANKRLSMMQESGFASSFSSYLLAHNYLALREDKKALPLIKRLSKDAPTDKNVKSMLTYANRQIKGTSKLIEKPLVTSPLHKSEVLSLTGGARITVVVPCYNEARFLADCLNSIWMQNFPFWECIIVDDTSSDASAKIAKSYCKADPRFRYVRHKENKGLSGSRNTGLEYANAPYITFVDGDDYLGLDSLNSRYQSIDKADDPFMAGVYCHINHVPEHELCATPPRPKSAEYCEVKNFATTGFEAPFNAHAPLLKTELLRKLGGFDETMRLGAEDWEFWHRIMRAGYFFKPTKWVGGYYRQKRGSMVRALSKNHVEEAVKLYQKNSEKNEEVGNASIFAFTQPAWVYQGAHKFYRRGVRFATVAYLTNDMAGFKHIIQNLPGNLEMCKALNISINSYVKEGVNRFLSTTDETIDGVNRVLFKTEKINKISDLISVMLDGRDAETNMEELFPVLSRSGKTSKKGKSRPAVTSGNRNHQIPAYVKLEESLSDAADEDRLKALHNIHAGERCFIVGNGPSLNKLDLSKLKNETSIAVNGIFYMTETTGYKPTYYVVEDTSVMKENLAEIIAYDVEKKFFPTIYSKIHPHDDNTYFFRMNRGFYERTSPNFCVPRFSTDFSQRAFCGQSVTFINLQMAFHMGFTEIYLIGMDFSYTIPEEFERKGDIITSTGDDPNHFHKDYFGKGKTWKDPKLDRVLANYRMAKLAYETAGRKIYNATAGGSLEEFERVDFDSLF